MNENEEYLQGQRDYVLLLFGAFAGFFALVLVNTMALLFNGPQTDLFTQISIMVLLGALSFFYRRRYKRLNEE